MHSPLPSLLCALLVLSLTPLAFAQETPQPPTDSAAISDLDVIAELAERLNSADVLAYDAREPLAAVEEDGLKAIHRTPTSLTLYASVMEGMIADWIVTDSGGRVSGVQPLETASGGCWVCGSADDSVVCWQVACTYPDEPPEAP